MSLSTLALSLTLLFWSFIGFGWLSWDMKVVYVFALITACLLLLEGLSPVSLKWPHRQ
jgi:hypothetical protein